MAAISARSKAGFCSHLADGSPGRGCYAGRGCEWGSRDAGASLPSRRHLQRGGSVQTRRDFAIAAGAMLLAGAARAQTYPDHPIRILIGYPAGGGVDLVARVPGEPMKAALGQPIVVENRPGASAMLAAQAVATAPPDGHTLLMAAAGEIATNQHLYKEKMTYDPLRQLAPVALVGIVPLVGVVAAATPVHTPAELIAYARANRGELSLPSAGIGHRTQRPGG